MCHVSALSMCACLCAGLWAQGWGLPRPTTLRAPRPPPVRAAACGAPSMSGGQPTCSNLPGRRINAGADEENPPGRTAASNALTSNLPRQLTLQVPPKSAKTDRCASADSRSARLRQPLSAISQPAPIKSKLSPRMTCPASPARPHSDARPRPQRGGMPRGHRQTAAPAGRPGAGTA